MRSSTNRRSRRLGWLVAIAAAFGAFLALGAGNALAFSCASVDTGGVRTVTLTLLNETVTVSKGNLSGIFVNNVQCGDATTSNTDVIVVIANGASDSLIIDEGGGRFEPGTFAVGAAVPPAEAAGSLNEIEWVLTGTNVAAAGVNNNNGVETLTILGNAAADTINVGSGGAPVALDPADPALTFATVSPFVNLNGDDDGDIYVDVAATSLPDAVGPDTLANSIYPDSITVRGRAGNDVLTGKGGLGTGGPATPVPVGFPAGDQTVPPFTIPGLTLDGGDGDDSLQGSEGNDTLIGGAGNDVIDGDDNSDPGDAFCLGFVVNVGTGQVEGPQVVSGDVVSFAGSTGPITIDLDPGELHPGSATGDGTDVVQNVEGIVGSPANDTISGDNADNVIFGGAGDDTIAGDAGDDCEFGNDGNDTFDENEGTTTAQGGTGTDNGEDVIFGNAGLDDTITYSARTTRVNVFLEALLGGFDSVEGCLSVNGREPLGFVGFAPDGADLDGDGFSGDDENDCVFQDTENVITGSGNDLISAAFVNNRADNEFTDNAGNDLMDGGAGNDTFHQGAAAQGSDDMDGGTGSDLCDYSLRTNPVSVNLDGADNDGEAGEGDNCGGVVDTFFFVVRAPQGIGGDEGDPIAGQDVENVAGGSGNDNLTGSDEANVLTGNAGNDTLTGNGGTDVLNGGDGDDLMIPGAGNDTAAGGAGTDTVDYASAGAGGVGVNVNLATGTASGEGNDTISDTENASGSSFADSMRGTTGANVLNSRGGNDAVQALAGDDTVNGGAGQDVLNAGGGNDRVSGGTGQDTIRGAGGNDNLNGGPAADTLMGGAGNDVLSGGAGPDDHRGGPGSDRCNPGAPGLGRGDTAQGCET
jgi:Ca2+-binding RTX toxin-like protein